MPPSAPSPQTADGAQEAVLAVARAMAAQLSPLALAEVERALAMTLGAPPTARERRLAQLGPLARMLVDLPRPQNLGPLDSKDPKIRWEIENADRQYYAFRRGLPRLAQVEYDQRRPPEAPSGPELTQLYGSWPRVIRAATAMRPDDGRVLGGGLPWTQPMRGKECEPKYTRAEVIAAYRACAIGPGGLGRRPSCNAYMDWAAKERRRLREAGSPSPRLPTWLAISRHFRSWPALAAAVPITDTELSEARRRRLGLGHISHEGPGNPRAALDLLTQGELDVLGFSHADCEQLREEGFDGLPLSRAVQLALALDGSLDWLAGRHPFPGRPPATGVRFDGKRFADLRRERKLGEKAVREALGGIALGPYRRLLSGKQELTLGQLAALAGLVNAEIPALSRS